MKKLFIVSALFAVINTAQAFDVEAKYKRTCFACHGSGVAGAPKSFDKASWEPALTKGMDALVANVTNGMSSMPPKGLCMDCTPEQFEALIVYMANPKE